MSEEQQAELLVTGDRVLTMDQELGMVEKGGVAIAGDTIVAVAEAGELRQRFPRARWLHTDGGVVMPGLINCHTHAAMACFRGLADDLPLMTWLNDYIFPVESRLTSELVYQSSLLAMAEMLRSGTTSFCDMYLFADQVARAAEQAGLRAWIGEVLYDFPSPHYGELENGFAFMEEMFTRYRDHPLITITVDPHAVYTCSPELLQRLKKVAERHHALYVIHLSETADEVAGCESRYGCRPVAHLDRLGVLDSQVVADHCVELTGQEIELLARRGVRVAHCPESNMKLASGVAPVVELLAGGVTVGLGTDGAASNNDVDLFGEMDTCAKLHKVHRLDPTVMDAETTLSLATGSAAALLGAETRLGRLAPGCLADCIVVDFDQPHLTPCYHLPSHLVYAARGGDVLHSVVGGRLVMENRRLLSLDLEEILAGMEEVAQRIRGWLA